MKNIISGNKGIFILLLGSFLIGTLLISLVLSRFFQKDYTTNQPIPTPTHPYLPYYPQKVETIEEKKAAQSRSDEYFGEIEKEAYIKYPWAKLLPLKGPEYFTYLDIGKNAFITKLYLTPTSDENDVKNNVLTRLQGIGVDLKKFSVEWITIPEPE